MWFEQLWIADSGNDEGWFSQGAASVGSFLNQKTDSLSPLISDQRFH